MWEENIERNSKNYFISNLVRKVSLLPGNGKKRDPGNVVD